MNLLCIYEINSKKYHIVRASKNIIIFDDLFMEIQPSYLTARSLVTEELELADLQNLFKVFVNISNMIHLNFPCDHNFCKGHYN